MSTDEAVTKDLIETLEDGREGFARAADKLDGDGRSDIASAFRQLSAQRASFSADLRGLAAEYGDQINEDGSALAALHRGWLSLKDALSGSNPDGVLSAAEQGEEHAVKEYRRALERDLSPTLRSVVERQLTAIQSAHDQVQGLRHSN